MAKRMSLFEIIDTLSTDCQTALGISNNEIVSAERSAIDCIVTRNPEHYQTAQIAIYNPNELLK